MDTQQTNHNRITTNDFSNPASDARYHTQWKDEPDIVEHFYENGKQCGGCSFFAKFNLDWGLCCHPDSRHHLETVFEHFTCASYVEEGWDAHRFLTTKHRKVIETNEKRDVAICDMVSNYVIANKLGIVTNQDTPYLLHEFLWPFKPDLGFIAKNRPTRMQGTSYLTPPDLAIKIVTSFDTAEMLNAEVFMYLQAGTRQVWVLYPRYHMNDSTVYVHTLTEKLNFSVRLLMKGDMLDGADVLPGFRIPIRDIFQYRPW